MKDDEGNGNVLVAMSGGIDSSVTAYLLKKKGFNVKSAILRMHDAAMSEEDLVNGKLPVAIWHAREASRMLRLDFNIIDVRDDFDDRVVKYFIRNYEQGISLDLEYYTQKHMQIPQMLQAAGDLGCSKVATGHYAIIEFDEQRQRYILKKGTDAEYDQSYKLYRLSQDEMSRVITPLGRYSKEEIRKTAASIKLKSAKAEDGFCFIPDDKYWIFVAKRLKELAGEDVPAERIIGLTPGNFVDRSGHVYGQHKGFLYYTVGKRNNLDTDIPDDLWVCEKNAKTNEIVLAKEEELYRDTVRAVHVNYVSLPGIPEGMRVTAKLQYGQKDEFPGTARVLEDGKLEVKFDDPVKAPVPGLGMVLYDGDEVIAGGVISAD